MLFVMDQNRFDQVFFLVEIQPENGAVVSRSDTTDRFIRIGKGNIVNDEKIVLGHLFSAKRPDRHSGDDSSPRLSIKIRWVAWPRASYDAPGQRQANDANDGVIPPARQPRPRTRIVLFPTAGARSLSFRAGGGPGFAPRR